jgi:uncharacterized delta-60 repeat protein
LRNGVSLLDDTSSALVVTNAQGSQGGSVYQVIVNNLWGSATSTVAELTVNRAVADGFNPAPNGEIDSMAIQPNGSIVISGYFSSLNATPRNRIGRVDSDGSLDTSFDPGTNIMGRAIHSLGLQVNGNIIVGGDFITSDGEACLMRLHQDGARDMGFRARLRGVVSSVQAIAIQNDSRILIGGIFSTLGGESHANLARLNCDGTIDSTFNPSLSNGVLSVAVQPDGYIVIAGYPGFVNGVMKNGIARLGSDGTLDTNFTASADTTIAAVTVQPDGKILVGGFFQSLDGFTLRDSGYIGRLYGNGAIDKNFNPEANGPVYSLALQADGRIIVAGQFTRLGGESRNSIGRLNSDGSVDLSFQPTLSDTSGLNVDCVVVQPDGKTLVGGSFDTMGGLPRQQLARLQSTDLVSTTLRFDGSTIAWTRGGPAPELTWTVFDGSTNGSDWFPLGSGDRVPGGWRIRNVSLPIRASIKARGNVQGGSENGSTWFVEEAATVNPLTAPIIFARDESFGLTSSTFGFDVGGLIGQTIVVERSSDFLRWDAVATNLLQTGRFHFEESTAVRDSPRFFRARLQ